MRGNDLILEKIEPSSDWIKTEAETDQKGEKYTIMIMLDKSKLPKGNFKETIKIHTRYREISEVVNVVIEGEVV